MRDRSERGSVFVETALVGLVVMALALGLVQFGVWFHAQHVVLGAAQEGAHAAALDGATPEDGEIRAQALVKAGLGNMASATSAVAQANDRLASVRVEATMPSIVPFLPAITLGAEGRAFRERFVADGELP